MAKPPALPIPTGIAWIVLERIIGGQPLEQIAKIAAYGAVLSGKEKDEGTVIERFRQFLRRQVRRGKAPTLAKADALLAGISAACRHKLFKTFPEDRAEQLFTQFATAKGPFTALALMVQPADATPAFRSLMELSGALDQMGATFGEAAAADDVVEAKSALINAENIDEIYWAAPDLSAPEANANRVFMRDAENWEQVTRAAAPLIFNCSLSWLSLLDVATLSVGKYAGADFPLFLPFMTQCSKRQLGPGTFEANRERLPVANLIRMVVAIAEDIRVNQLCRNVPWMGITPGENNADIRAEHKSLKRHDFITMADFSSLLKKLLPAADGIVDDERWFDIYALMLATNMFSLFTPRDGKTPEKISRRKVPVQIACFPEIEAGYWHWWAQHRNRLAGNRESCPRPSWFTGLQAETGSTDRDG